MQKADIIAAITTRVGGSGYGSWRIGLAHDLVDRQKYWKETEKQNVACWGDWKADSLSDAQDIESHFINKGIKGGTGGDFAANKIVYVYIF